MHQDCRRFMLAGAALALMAGTAGAQTLTMGVIAGPESIDPHFTATGTHRLNERTLVTVPEDGHVEQ